MISINRIVLLACMIFVSQSVVAGDGSTLLPVNQKIDIQPLWASVVRIREALEFLGDPLPKQVWSELRKARREKDAAVFLQKVQEILDPLCLLGVRINPESRVKVQQGSIKPILDEQGWRQYLIKVVNEVKVMNAQAPIE